MVLEEAKSKVVALCEDQCFQMPFAPPQHQADKEEPHSQRSLPGFERISVLAESKRVRRSKLLNDRDNFGGAT